MTLRFCIGTALLLCACGDSSAAKEPTSVESSGADIEESEPEDTMEVSGLMGAIPEREIHATLEAKLPKFQRCFFHGMDDVEVLGGHVKFYFRVNKRGEVEWVHPRGSSIGHRGTELCLLREAATSRFPKPAGGDAAEFVWGFELETPGGVRPPVAWDEERVRAVVARERDALAACGDGSYVVTAYVNPGGEVLAAGAAADSQEAAEAIDCVVDAVRTWKMPDPGSYPAKVSFGIP